jgi:serine/threonine protein kinase
LVVFENTSYTSFLDYLAVDDNQRFLWQRLYEAALGLSYLHERGIVLGKIQCDDVWVGTDGLAKVAVFGLDGRHKDVSGGSDISGVTGKHARITNLLWSSPEVLRGEPATSASDVFSLGVCIAEAVGGGYPDTSVIYLYNW